MKAIEASDLGKLYERVASRRRETLREALAMRLRGRRRPESFWALRGASFDLDEGEAVGLIGRNGAGKSTLLKILSRITPPTTGRALIRGRVGSLLEVGTGFHPDLTGRDNIYLSGAILGMTRRDIDRRLDEIVAFAEVEPFVDTPVKRYSSGMFVRLAFAVAAHLHPQVLLVDEVLAVGDLAFQRKCLQHMADLSRAGLTLLLVSHNLASIQSACRRAIVLERGEIAFDGPALEAIARYRALLHEPEDQTATLAPRAPVDVTAFELLDSKGQPTRTIRFGEAPSIRIQLRAAERLDAPMVNFGIKRGDGVIVCNFNNWYDGYRIDFVEGDCSLEGALPPMRLVPDYYEIHVLVWPWEGGHASGDLTRARPLAERTFGTFQVVGPPFNTHDGVFQQPARQWILRRGAHEQVFTVGHTPSVDCWDKGHVPASGLSP